MQFELKRWKECYAADIASYADDPMLARLMPTDFPSPFSEDDACRMIENCLNADESRFFSRAVIIDGKAVGSVTVEACTGRSCKDGILSFWIGEPFREHRVMTGAVRSACAEAFRTLDIIRISAYPRADNLAARCVLNNAGFAFEGVRKHSVFVDGIIFDSCTYALLSDWLML